MIPAIEFLLAVSIVAAAGAMLLETGLRHLGLPTRWPWLAALALGPGLLAARLTGAGPVSAPAPLALVPMIELPAVGTSGVGPWVAGMDGVAALVWLASAMWVLVVVARSHRGLTLESAGWERARVMGREVFLSTDRGPAVAGVWDPWIVLPRWLLALPERELRLILVHEEEHVHAKDTRLLGAALGLVALTAWNPVAWWHLRRLRATVELDCDRRVLTREPDRATYGASLLSVAARGVGPSLGLAAFTEGSFNLKRRILAMTAKATAWTALGGGVLVALGVVVGVQACGIESPVERQTAVAPGAPAAPAPVLPPSDPALREAPVPTPYTKAPDLVNRAEVATAMEAAYSAELRAQMRGTATVYIFIDEQGDASNVVIQKSSGYPALDEAALTVARVMRFIPARNRGAVVPVWVSLPITFQTR